ncbi:hypothetical protein BHE97_08020 [Aeromicrobium sp. PE09-221]|uniref:hypothetical protein n=1 Tax=Aeromicrobium sp. PE09-221 TaxID=1898043 RepID=UPI000B69E5CF|nr:hypothetical protein [Aeromicrobium sp. PE09-221]OUZ10287.1 hypothetical protein BHE97_08020 [Aeromicrobium sp. PE09-221]
MTPSFPRVEVSGLAGAVQAGHKPGERVEQAGRLRADDGLLAELLDLRGQSLGGELLVPELSAPSAASPRQARMICFAPAWPRW